MDEIGVTLVELLGLCNDSCWASGKKRSTRDSELWAWITEVPFYRRGGNKGGRILKGKENNFHFELSEFEILGRFPGARVPQRCGNTGRW